MVEDKVKATYLGKTCCKVVYAPGHAVGRAPSIALVSVPHLIKRLLTVSLHSLGTGAATPR